MEILTISGGSGLFGEVRIPGAKNSVLPIMAASVLCRGTVTLTDVPHLSDVEASARILQSVGCKVLLENGRAVITPPEFPGSAVPEPLMRAMRSSLFYLAPLLARTGRADIYTPGGCRLGARPIDMHLSGLEKMGAHITEKDGGALEVTAPDGLAGADICLRFPSVGATETLLMAAAAARGETVLRGAAVEPEVTDLARFLQGAGADITGVGTRVLHIRGRELLMGTQHAVCPTALPRPPCCALWRAAAARCCSPIPATPIWPRCCASCAGPDAWCRSRGQLCGAGKLGRSARREGGIRACIHRSQRTRHP
ncbi:MAG: UDP-N-acetylglucosamine 1-carboxyvinyltransferase [Ruthenibacterium lactatiformans]